MENSTESAKVLLQRGAEIETRDKNNFTPLHYATAKNSRETAQLLLERGRGTGFIYIFTFIFI